jgi:hypothetical protein
MSQTRSGLNFRELVGTVRDVFTSPSSSNPSQQFDLTPVDTALSTSPNSPGLETSFLDPADRMAQLEVSVFHYLQTTNEVNAKLSQRVDAQDADNKRALKTILDSVESMVIAHNASSHPAPAVSGNAPTTNGTTTQLATDTTAYVPTLVSFTPATSTPAQVQGPVQPALPPLKSAWPLLSDTSFFESWRSIVLGRIATSEIGSVYDETTGDVITDPKLVSTDVNKRLYALLIDCLPPSNSFHSRSDLRTNGILLWRNIVSSYDQSNSHLFSAKQISDFWAHTTRADNENIDEYYNRFMTLADRIEKGPLAPRYSADTIRRQFIVTLGTGFDHLREQVKNGQLDPKYLSWDINMLLSDLRATYLSQKMCLPTAVTASSMGYAHAAMSNNNTAFSKEDRASLDQIQASFAKQQIANDRAVAESLEKTQQKQARDNGADSWCWTHGFTKNLTHNSVSCNQDNRKPGHIETATASNPMGGNMGRAKPKA